MVKSRKRAELEAQVVESVTEAKKPAESKKKPSASKEPKTKKAKVDKKGKDPNMPKRLATSFFIFMDEFRKSFKEANPGSKGVKEAAKEGGEKWKSMTEEEKKPYTEKAAELKAEYEKAMEKFNSANADDEDVVQASDKETKQVSDNEQED